MCKLRWPAHSIRPPAMAEGGRTRSSRSSTASSQKTLGAESSSSRRNSGFATDESASECIDPKQRPSLISASKSRNLKI
ncbi:hypothetical protein AVEN_244679-1 [Araneus ventricosus]|uniref:Uncharacterized protein n=1 Tax=Araneus ventricosus TaxID=182803 RepID=A0A4Y2KJJ5_ARAVE|nr:hypothetical protein AVEN_244679-1 [Araneus ventricosus]